MPYKVLDPTQAAAAPVTTVGAPLVSTGETLASIQTELLLRLGSRTDISTPRLSAWINKGYRNVAGMLTLKELEGSIGLSLVAAQPFYALPLCVSFIKRLGVQDSVHYNVWQGRELGMIDQARYRNLPEETNPPTAYFRQARMVVIWPTPDTAYTAPLDFKVRPNDLVNATDSPLLPTEFHHAIILQAHVVALGALLNWTDQAKVRNEFVTEIKPLLNTDAEESSGQNAVVSPTYMKKSLFRTRRA